MFKKLIFYIILSLFTNDFVLSQKDYSEYYRTIVKAKETNHIDSIIYYYYQAFKINQPFFEDLIACSDYLFEKHDTIESQKLLMDAVLNGYQIKPEIAENKGIIIDYTPFIYNSVGDFEQFKNRILSSCYDSLRLKYLNQCNQIDQYEYILSNEYYYQKLRVKLLNDKKTEKKMNWRMHQNVASPHLDLIFNLLRTNSFPERRKSKHFNSWNLSIVMLHAVSALELKDSELFFNLLFKEVKKGNIQPVEYCNLYDYYHCNFIKRPWSYSTFGTIVKNDIIVDVLDPDRINQKRFDYYLQSIESFSNNFNYALPKNYIKK